MPLLCCLPFTSVGRLTNSAHMSVGLLQLIANGTNGLWHQSLAICPECSWRSLWWGIQIWFCDHLLRDKLHWLPIGQGVGLKAIDGHALNYLKGFVVPVSYIPALSQKRSAAAGDFIIPFATTNITYCRRSFPLVGSTFWNSLPLKIALVIPIIDGALQ